MSVLSNEWIVASTVFLPSLAAVSILFFRKGISADVIGMTTAVVTALLSSTFLPEVLSGFQPTMILLPLLPGVDLVWRVDSLGLTFALLASFLWIAVSLCSSGYVRADNLQHRTRFFASFAASIGAAMGIAYSGNLLTFILFFETLTLTTYPLVVHKESELAMAAGRRYLLYALSGGLAVTVGCAWVWHLTGDLNFTGGGIAGIRQQSPIVVSALLLLLVGGCGVKAAIMPMHAWLPAAMVAPSPVSALLHAVAVVKAGVFGCMRMIGFVLGPDALHNLWISDVLAAFCAGTIVIGSFIAMRQDNLKRRLAYSTVVHLNYIVLGSALLTSNGFTGSVIHMVNHGLAKITLFLCAGSIYATTHFERVSQLKGLGRQMPYTCGAFTVAALALIGAPGLCGFPGKLFLVRGALDVGAWPHAAIMLGASVLTGAYLLPVIKAFYFDNPEESCGHCFSEAPKTMVIPSMVTAALAIAFGFVPVLMTTQFDLARNVTAAVFGGTP